MLSVCEILDSWADISKARVTELHETEHLISDTQVIHDVRAPFRQTKQGDQNKTSVCVTDGASLPLPPRCLPTSLISISEQRCELLQLTLQDLQRIIISF